MTLTTTRWNSPATLTCSSHRKDARCCRWGQRLKLSTANSPRNSRPSPGGWVGVGGWGGVTFLAPTAEPTHVTGGRLQPAPLSHWLAAPSPLLNTSSAARCKQARGMCRVLFLCICLRGCHGSSCVPQEQSRYWFSLFLFFFSPFL